jgi:hypothetical protein
LETDAPVKDVTGEARRIVGKANDKNVTLRLIGGLAIRFHCHGQHSSHLREYRDIDVFGLGNESEKISSVFQQLGYSPNLKYNLIYGGTRLQFVDEKTGGNVDVFLDKFRMDHTLDFKQRLQLDDLTIPITDLLLTKLQVVRLAEKDVKDIIAIVEDHQIGRKDGREILALDYVAERCSSDWGLYRTVADNLDKMNEFIQIIVPSSGEREELAAKLGAIRTSLKDSRKGIGWRIRNIIGRRVKWYEKVEVGEGEAF